MDATDTHRIDTAALRAAWQQKREQQPPVRLFELQRENETLRWEERRTDALVVFSRTATALSFVVLALDLLAWGGLRRAETQSVRSREAMLDAYGHFFRCLFVLFPLLASLPVFSAACLLAFVCAAPSDMRAGDDSSDILLCGLSVTCVVFGAYALIAALKFARRASVEVPAPMTGRRVTPEEEPKLWALVRDIARSMSARVPDHIVLGLEDTFFITSHEVLLRNGNRLRGCTLYLGVTYMICLSRRDFKAVVAHELAHYRGKDLDYSLRLAPFYWRARHLENVLASMSNDMASLSWLIQGARLLCVEALDGFFRSLSAWSRARELRADKVAAEVVGTRAAAEALVRVHVLTSYVAAALEQVRSGATRESVREVLLQKLQEKMDAAETLQQHLQITHNDPRDSHPSLRQRLEHFGVSLDAPWLVEAAHVHETDLLKLVTG